MQDLPQLMPTAAKAEAFGGVTYQSKANWCRF